MEDGSEDGRWKMEGEDGNCGNIIKFLLKLFHTGGGGSARILAQKKRQNLLGY